MNDNFYSSSEAAQITGCTRRQLQYWRQKGVVVPRVNPTGKGRNVYYSESDLLALTVMQYLLSLGLSFDVCQHILEVLLEQESWLFSETLSPEKMKRFMLLANSQDYPLELVDFDGDRACEIIKQGLPVVPFWSDRIHQRLRESLKSFDPR